MRSAVFVYLGLAKLLLPTAQALSKPMLSFPELQQARKKPHKMEKSMKDTRFQKASPLCAQRELPLHGGQLGFSPADQLPTEPASRGRGVQAEPSPQFSEMQHNWNWTGAASATGQGRSQGRAAWVGSGQGTLSRLLVMATQWEGWEQIFPL